MPRVDQSALQVMRSAEMHRGADFFQNQCLGGFNYDITTAIHCGKQDSDQLDLLANPVI